MLVWLFNLLIGQYCQHKWNIESIREVHGYYDERNNSYGKIGEKYVLQCEKCGNIKVVRT